MERHRWELEQVLDVLKKQAHRKRIWIHINGEEGGGKTAFIEHLVKASLKTYALIYQFEFSSFPCRTWLQIRDVLRHIFRHYETDFRMFLQQYPLKFQKQIEHLIDTDWSDDDIFIAEDHLEYCLLNQFLADFATRSKPLLVLNGVSDSEEKQVARFLNILDRNEKVPLLVISSGKQKFSHSLKHFYVTEILFRKLSVRETEQLVAKQLETGDTLLNRLITNHLYIKSGGIERKIKYMLEGFYLPLLKSGIGALENGRKLMELPISGSLEDIFKAFILQIEPKILDILSFLSRLEYPFPKQLLEEILEAHHLSKTLLDEWLNKELLQERAYLQNKYVLLLWKPWKEFLRKNTSVERITHILEYLRPQINKTQFKFPLGLANFYLAINQREAALNLAYREANWFVEMGETRRALERYAFIRRNVSRYPGFGVPGNKLLKEIGALQKKVGLYENAFETFRELSENTGEHDADEWTYAMLQRADTLFQMDELSEARHLLNDLKSKQLGSPFSEAFINLLMGELEENSGHFNQAIVYYDQAKSALPQLRDEGLILKMYSVLKRIYLKEDRKECYVELVRQILVSLDKASSLLYLIQLDLVKYYINEGNYKEALPLIIELYRKSKHFFTPTLFSQIGLYLAEVYGYYGKWYLARSLLRKMCTFQFLIPRQRTRLLILMNWGIVEKEIGRYGKAFTLLKDALQISKNQHDMRQKYQIKIHKGHLYLLTHNFMKAREYLLETLNWAEKRQDIGLIIAAALFLASYEMQRKRLDSARNYLDIARENIKWSNNQIDKLNYFYYLAQYELGEGNIKEAASVIKSWESQGQGIIKFEIILCWFSGKLAMEKGQLLEAREKFETALLKSIKYRLAYLELQVLRDLKDLVNREGKPEQIAHYHLCAFRAFNKFLENVGDEILQRQIKESREFEDFLNDDFQIKTENPSHS